MNEQPVYTAELAPHRSLGQHGTKILFLIAGFLSFIHCLFFLTTGAWPISLFFGVDFLLLYGAFWLNNRAAMTREKISLTRLELSICKISPSGQSQQMQYNPFWTRLQVSRKPEKGVTGIKVKARDQETRLGDFLYPDAREKFATEFTQALATVKQRL